MYYLKVFFAFLCFVSGQARSHDHVRPSPMQLIQRIRGYKNQIFGDGNDIATGFNDVSQTKFKRGLRRVSFKMVAHQRIRCRNPYLANATIQPSKLKLVSENIEKFHLCKL